MPANKSCGQQNLLWRSVACAPAPRGIELLHIQLIHPRRNEKTCRFKLYKVLRKCISLTINIPNADVTHSDVNELCTRSVQTISREVYLMFSDISWAVFLNLLFHLCLGISFPFIYEVLNSPKLQKPDIQLILNVLLLRSWNSLAVVRALGLVLCLLRNLYLRTVK